LHSPAFYRSDCHSTRSNINDIHRVALDDNGAPAPTDLTPRFAHRVSPEIFMAAATQLVTQATAIFRSHLLKCFTALQSLLPFLAKTLPVFRRHLLPMLAHLLPQLASLIRRQILPAPLCPNGRLRAEQTQQQGQMDKEAEFHE